MSTARMPQSIGRTGTITLLARRSGIRLPNHPSGSSMVYMVVLQPWFGCWVMATMAPF